MSGVGGYRVENWADPAQGVPGEGRLLGEVLWTPRRAFVRAQMSGAVAGTLTRGAVVVLDANNVAVALTTTAAGAAGRGARVGVIHGDAKAGQIGWVQVYGIAPIQLAASSVAFAALYSTATAGIVDDSATTGVIGGVRAGASVAAGVYETAELNWPTLTSVA